VARCGSKGPRAGRPAVPAKLSQTDGGRGAENTHGPQKDPAPVVRGRDSRNAHVRSGFFGARRRRSQNTYLRKSLSDEMAHGQRGRIPISPQAMSDRPDYMGTVLDMMADKGQLGGAPGLPGSRKRPRRTSRRRPVGDVHRRHLRHHHRPGARGSPVQFGRPKLKVRRGRGGCVDCYHAATPNTIRAADRRGGLWSLA